MAFELIQYIIFIALIDFIYRQIRGDRKIYLQ